jgi:hypothetical protein
VKRWRDRDLQMRSLEQPLDQRLFDCKYDDVEIPQARDAR